MKPVKTWRTKGVQLAAWENKDRVTFMIQKRYFDKKTDEWKETKTFFREDLMALKDMITEAAEWCLTGVIPEMPLVGPPKVSEVKITVGAKPQPTLIEDDDDIPF